jgi:hypothetical protein
MYSSALRIANASAWLLEHMLSILYISFVWGSWPFYDYACSHAPFRLASVGVDVYWDLVFCVACDHEPGCGM